ncbi:ArsR/SmtB family transcription factor [Methylobacterium nonmethylotrophicum]|uniref:ArsR family transcriptional regulator n=1 Tax=Methylobacterium nonmethylotrophicum TaxID=1141884 RepID=A0A4Z0ND53_9HYPH|nr:metalloregulator ArsR/SmtB family transcription factor [Methylobacterium nonmethylotrophicum]TGD91998.1 ArsR family transcriptional regulator [Methylobacterium nonmethylotrophicum]
MLDLDEERATELAEIFRLLGDASRLRIAVVCLDGPLCVSDIARRVGLSTSLVSHHLRLLRAARFVRSQKRGKQVFYGTTDAHVRCVVTDMVAHVSGKNCLGAVEGEDAPCAD